MAYGFYIAQVVSVSTIEDNRLQVRVLPQMEGIDKEKCPVWPSFFRDELYTGRVGDLVWVICDDEFSLGYVFGLANYNTYPDRTENVFEKADDGTYLSIPKSLREKISDVATESTGKAISLVNAKITYWDTQCVHFIERNGGGKVIAYNNGTLYIFRSDEIILKIGKNMIRLDEDTVSLVGKKIQIDSEYVGLGHNAARNVLVNDAISGMGATPSPYVFA